MSVSSLSILSLKRKASEDLEYTRPVKRVRFATGEHTLASMLPEMVNLIFSFVDKASLILARTAFYHDTSIRKVIQDQYRASATKYDQEAEHSQAVRNEDEIYEMTREDAKEAFNSFEYVYRKAAADGNAKIMREVFPCLPVNVDVKTIYYCAIGGGSLEAVQQACEHFGIDVLLDVSEITEVLYDNRSVEGAKILYFLFKKGFPLGTEVFDEGGQILLDYLREKRVLEWIQVEAMNDPEPNAMFLYYDRDFEPYLQQYPVPPLMVQ